MNSAIERLLTLRVADVMSKPVVPVASHESMADAARRLLQHSISGAPVVDEKQHCVGILSATDFVKKHGCGQDIQERSGDLVYHHMSPAVQSIAPEVPLLEAARMMCATHIHRLPVLDRQSRPVGMITALDLVAALVHAVEE